MHNTRLIYRTEEDSNTAPRVPQSFVRSLPPRLFLSNSSVSNIIPSFGRRCSAWRVGDWRGGGREGERRPWRPEMQHAAALCRRRPTATARGSE